MANKPDLGVKITADTAQAEAALSGLSDDLKKTEIAAEGAADGIQQIRNSSKGLLEARAALTGIQLEFAKVKDAAIQSGKTIETTVKDQYRKAMSSARTEVAKQRDALAKDMAAKPLEIPAKVVGTNGQEKLTLTPEQRRANYLASQVAPQATDIVTSLASGQNPFTVLIQQGGQLKDMFGGIGAAAKALAGYFTALLTPISLAVAAVGLLAVGFVKGQQEAVEFAKALALTNNAAGTSVDQLKNSADAIDNVAGTYANAADALTQLASSGVVGAGQLQELALAAIQLEKAGGSAMEDTIKNFVELGKNPVEASRRLGEQMGYLNRATYDQIRALQQAGKEADAAALAQTAYKEAIAKSTAKIEESLGTLERAAKATGGFFKEMWDAILSVGREDTLEQKVAKVEARLESLRKAQGAGFNRAGGAGVADAQAELQSLLDQIDARDQAAQKQAEQVKANRKDMDEADRDFADRGERELAAAKARNDRMLAEIDAANAAVKSAYDDGLTNLEEYYKARGFLIDQQNKAELDQLKAQLAAAQAVAAKNPLDRGAQAAVTSAQGAITSAQISGASKVAQNLNEATRAASDYADAIDKINLQLQENAGLETSAEAARLRRVTAEAQYRKQMGEATTPEQRASIQRTIDAQVAVGNLKAEQAKTERDLYTYTKQRADIELQIQNGQISQIDGQRQLYDLEQQRNTEYLSMLQKMQQIPDLTEQQKNALQQAIDNAKRGLEQLSPLAQQFNTTLRSGLEDAFANALMRVTSLKDGLKAVAQQIAMMFAKKAAAEAVSSFLPTFKFADGGYVRGPGTTTSDSIPALLSDREFVQPAHVVDHYGVDFMEAIRRLQIPKLPTTAVATSSQKLGRYAAGGLVGQPAASAASGAKIPVQVNIQNSGTGKTATSDASFDGKSVVVSVLLDDIKNNGPIFSGLNSAQRIRR